ncbi:MAG: hypothetical protein RLZZ563_1246 [Pseudomonadota bacterium]
MRKAWTIFFLVNAIVLVVAFAVVSSHGFPFAFMDLNDDGFVSPAEYLMSVDLGHRPVTEGQKLCTEVFLLKDGLPLKVVCEGR